MFSTSHTYGYGINVNSLNRPRTDALKAFIEQSDAARDTVIEWEQRSIADHDLGLATYAYSTDRAADLYELYSDYGDYSVYGLAGIVHLVLSKCIGIPLVAMEDDESGNTFVIMPSYYPWELNDRICAIKSEQDIKELFARYLRILTPQTVDMLGWGEYAITTYGQGD